MFVTIDPGEQTGWSLWDARLLLGCGLATRLIEPDATQGVSCAWIESQVIYPRSRARPADLITLAHNAGRWSGFFAAKGVDTRWVEPVQWKGQIPKPKRGEVYIVEQRVSASLSVPEKAVLENGCRNLPPTKRHNVIDAVGIGLWALKQGAA